MDYVGTELDLFSEATYWKRYLAESLRPYLGERVLEVGAGIGGTTGFLCKGTEVSWLCAEPDPALAAVIAAKVTSGTLPQNCTIHVGTIEDISPAARFDTIVYIDVLEHIHDDRTEIARAADRLSPDGTLVVLAPAHQWLFSPFDAAVGHYRRYNKKSLRALEHPSLRVLKIFYLDSVGLLASLGNRLLLRQSAPTKAQIAMWDGKLVPISRISDPLTGFQFGRSVIAVWKKCEGEPSERHDGSRIP